MKQHVTTQVPYNAPLEYRVAISSSSKHFNKSNSPFGFPLLFYLTFEHTIQRLTVTLTWVSHDMSQDIHHRAALSRAKGRRCINHMPRVPFQSQPTPDMKVLVRIHPGPRTPV